MMAACLALAAGGAFAADEMPDDEWIRASTSSMPT